MRPRRTGFPPPDAPAEANLPVELLERRGPRLAAPDHPPARAQRGVELGHGRQLEVDHAVGADLGGEDGDGEAGVVGPARAGGQVEVAFVVGA